MSKQHTMAERPQQLGEVRIKVETGGGAEKLEKQHARGKMTARGRIEELIDEGSFQETGALRRNRIITFGTDKVYIAVDGVVTGSATVLGRPVHLASQDFTVMGGLAGGTHSIKVTETLEASLSTGIPFIFIDDSGGARMQEGIDSLSGYGKVFYANVLLFGAVPQISIISGSCADGAACSSALTDFTIQTRKAHMFTTDPGVIKQAADEGVTQDALDGVDAHMGHSGVIGFVADGDEQAILITKKLLGFLPQNNSEEPPIADPDDSIESNEKLREIVPLEGNKGYDIHDIIAEIADRRDFLEVQADWARNIMVGFARINGRSIGIITNQPSVMSGVLDIDSSGKGSKFIRLCNAFNIPMVNLVDVPDSLPGVAQEHGGITRHGAKMLFAYSAVTVPKITVVLRKVYGDTYLAMCSKDLGAGKVFAWLTTEIAVMGAEGAADVVFRHGTEAAEDTEARREELVEEYCETFSTPYAAASRGLVDDIIDPADTRREITLSLELLTGKCQLRPAKEHGLFPVWSESQMSDNDATPLAAVEKLAAQFKTLDERLAKLEARQGIPEEDLVAIGVAVAASLGHKAKVRVICSSAQFGWVQATREQPHSRAVPHVR